MSHTVNHECNQCEYRAATHRNLIQHLLLVHEKATYDCIKYEYIATYIGNIALHI